MDRAEEQWGHDLLFTPSAPRAPTDRPTDRQTDHCRVGTAAGESEREQEGMEDIRKAKSTHPFLLVLTSHNLSQLYVILSRM